MKIRKIEVFSVRVPLKRAAESAHGLAAEQNSVIAKVLTGGGGYGIGAVDPLPGYDEESGDEILATLQNHLIPRIIGENPFQIRRIVEIMDADIPGHLGSKAIIEMALFDLLGKTLGVPVHTCFGGKVKDPIQLNGWIGLVAPEEAKKQAQDLLDKGFRSLKVKINPDVEAGKRRVEAVRSVVKNKIQVRVDANESLNLEQAQEIARGLEPFDIFYLEQPFPRDSFEDFAAFSRVSPVKLMADESIHDMESLLRILRSGSAHFVKVKVQKLGGFLKTYQAVQVAEAFGIPVILGHGFGLTINTLAELHLAGSTHAILDGCEAVGPFKMADDVVKKPLFMDKGFIPLPNKPGLGADLDEIKLKKYCLR